MKGNIVSLITWWFRTGIKIETGSGTGSGIRLELELGLELILY